MTDLPESEKPVSDRTKRVREMQASEPQPDDERAFTVTWSPGYEPTPEDEAAVAELVEAAWKMMEDRLA